MLEHGAKRTGVAGVHVAEKYARGSRIGNVTVALVPEKRGLQAAETMPLIVAMPEPPRMVKHVHVRHVRKRRRQSVQRSGDLDERKIERLAVVGDDCIDVAGNVSDRFE